MLQVKFELYGIYKIFMLLILEPIFIYILEPFTLTFDFYFLDKSCFTGMLIYIINKWLYN